MTEWIFFSTKQAEQKKLEMDQSSSPLIETGVFREPQSFLIHITIYLSC
jgi:hypothetical protein